MPGNLGKSGRNRFARVTLRRTMQASKEVSFGTWLIGALEKLAAKKVTNRKELDAWRSAAEKLERRISAEGEASVPPFVWHYLGDADIRMRNAKYRADQERQLERVLRELGPRAHRIGAR